MNNQEETKSKVRYTDMTSEQKREYHKLASAKQYEKIKAARPKLVDSRTPEQKLADRRAYKAEWDRVHRPSKKTIKSEISKNVIL